MVSRLVSLLALKASGRVVLFHLSSSLVRECPSSALNPVVDVGDIVCPFQAGDIKISHLLFADDLMVFCSADTRSALSLSNLLKDFFSFSGLKANCSKNQIILSKSCQIGPKIISIFNMTEENLPIIYLSLPLFSSLIQVKDCDELLKVQNMINGWSSVSLSYAGRLKLLHSTINHLHLFWANSFILPKYCLQEVEKIMWAFFWGADTNLRKIHMVSWDKMCKPKSVVSGLGACILSTRLAL